MKKLIHSDELKKKSATKSAAVTKSKSKMLGKKTTQKTVASKKKKRSLALSGDMATAKISKNVGTKRTTTAKKKSAKKLWELKLYVAGQTEKSVAAFQNLKQICETHLKGEYSIEVIDLLRRPQLAKGDQIFATPTLVKKLPTPVKRIIGDLSNTERVLVGLNLRPLR